MMRTQSIRVLILIQAFIALLLLVSYTTFMAFEVAWLSALLVVLGSMYSYRNLVNKRLESYETGNDPDAIDRLEDPYDLYSETIENEEDTRELKTVIKEEKARLKASKVNGIKEGAPAMISLYRVVPYLLLVLGFIGLKNNEMLELVPYLIGLGVGILSALWIGKSSLKKAV